MYTIIGGDGREYGPVSAEQVRQWIAAGRANGQTRAKVLGTEEWKILADFADFTAAPPVGSFESGEGGPAAVATVAPLGHFDPLECFNRSWDLLRRNFWPFVGVSCLIFVVMFGPSVAVRRVFPYTPDMTHPFLYFQTTGFWSGIWISLLLTQPFYSGTIYYFLKKARGQEATFADLFAGFTRAYWPLVASILLTGLFEFAGLLFFVIPGIYLAVAYALSHLAIVDQRVGPWTGMELSRQAVTRRWWSFFLLLILSVIIMLVGAIALGVGVLVALPLVFGAMAYAYLDLVPGSSGPAANQIVQGDPTRPEGEQNQPGI